MQYTTSDALCALIRALPARLHILAVVCFVALALMGFPLAVGAGWWVWPPLVYVTPAPQRRRTVASASDSRSVRAGWQWASRTWQAPLCRSLLVQIVWSTSGHSGPAMGALLPWLAWLCQLSGVLWPSLTRQPEWQVGQCVVSGIMRGPLWLIIGVALSQAGQAVRCVPSIDGHLLLVGGLVSPATVTVQHDADKRCYRATLSGEIHLAVAEDDPYRLRLFVLFLRWLDAGTPRGSRRTRTGRTPLVRQQALAQSLGITQPEISRWERYWLEGNWADLLSLYSPQVLTHELREQIITTWAHWPLWTAEQVWHLLTSQGVAVTLCQVQQAGHESGWQIVRQTLGRLCQHQAGDLRLRENRLVGDLLAHNRLLMERLESGQGLPAEQRLDVAACQAAASAAGLGPRLARPLRPWLRQVEQVLFQPWNETMVGDVRCTFCGSADVGRKSNVPRLKRVVNAAGDVQTVAVYRYYCHNPACARKSFTAFPPGVLPYTAHAVQAHVLVLQVYAWGRSVYRRAGEAAGVATMTAYRWVSAFGAELLPVAALFGVVRSSGVVGVDEKWVLVPKNGKAAGENRRWMYVYLAVDCYTYDLLHIAIYERNTKESAQAFLLALRAKGYRPRVVVTDLRQDYGPALAAVFPGAQHHECLFHAGKALHRQMWDLYGRQRYHHDRQVVALRETLDAVLAAETKRTAQRRYEAVMAQREALVASEPGLRSVFATLETHWPTLINGIESTLIPRTNNTVELVIRRFDQHYQNMCGFESVQTAAVFLGVFEKVYRFTPFSQDAQPRLRGKSPLELAGYDVAQMPMANICQGWASAMPAQRGKAHVPN